ncbi:MAG: LacI family transcriptional regulator [Lachnospiraceae bacterium]|nr:LacI family transcriptional regulator [Lachnospiraceae bacterium]MDE6253398.1 LacI family transcriptional regulator [Lachnospiraceae bacterium]
MDKNRVRIADIAEELGLSTATVSNVIHGKTSKVSDETIKRVQELIEKRQYMPGMAEILLAQNNSGIIGVVINNHEKYESHVLEDAFISSSLNFLSEEIEKAGYFMMVKTTNDYNQITRFASMWNMEGLVIIGFCEQEYKKLRDTMRIPFVVYDGYITEQGRLCNLIIDNYDGGYQMGRYFHSLGHRKVLCISDNDVCMDLERFEGFKAGMEGEDVDFMIIPMEKEDRRRYYLDNLSRLKKYSAIFSVSDYYAIDIMQFLMDQGIRIPEEISVAGFDDCPVCEMVRPSLTTIRQDGRLRADLAIDMLKKLKNHNESGMTIKLPVTLVKRNSVR